jgi:hypothetical protein
MAPARATGGVRAARGVRGICATGIAALVLVASAAGCGDDDSADDGDDGEVTTTLADDAGEGRGEDDDAASTGSRRQDYVDAIVEVADEGDPSFGVDERTCVAESFVDAFGADEIAAAGVAPDDIRRGEDQGPGDLGLDFSEAQQSDFYERLSGCMDIRALFIAGLSAGGELPPEAVDCLDANIDDDLLERFFTTGFTQGDEGFDEDPALEQEFQDAVAPCMALSGP